MGQDLKSEPLGHPNQVSSQSRGLYESVRNFPETFQPACFALLCNRSRMSMEFSVNPPS